MHVAIRADGGPGIGYGHLVRSRALAEELLARGHTVTVATTTSDPAQTVFPDIVEQVSLPSRSDPEPFVAWLDTTAPDIVFTDSYPVNTAYQRAIRERVQLAVLQDDDRYAVCADLFVNGNLYAPDLDYEFVGEEPETCLGPDYVLLRREIRDRAADDPPWREQPERALVIMGGSDISNLTSTVIRAFNGFDIHVDAIVGPGVPKKGEQSIRTVASEISPAVSVVRDPDDLIERMFQADFAVSTASSTTYELFALGTPIITVPVADNQEPIAEALREHNAATVLKYGVNKTAFRQAIKKFLLNPSLRKQKQTLGRKLVDTKGVHRIAEAILSIVET